MWMGEREKGTKGISHKLAYDLSPAIRHKKKEKRMEAAERERDSVCWCNHRHKVSMSKRWNKKEKRASMCIIHKRISLLAAGLSPSCSRFFFLGPTKNININFTCPHTHPKKVGNHFFFFFSWPSSIKRLCSQR